MCNDAIFCTYNSVPVLTDKLLHMFLKRCGTGLLSLDLSSAPPYHLTEYSLDLVGQYCRSLRHLNLAHMAITRVALKTMAQRLTQLQVCVCVYIYICDCDLLTLRVYVHGHSDISVICFPLLCFTTRLLYPRCMGFIYNGTYLILDLFCSQLTQHFSIVDCTASLLSPLPLPPPSLIPVLPVCEPAAQ